MRLKVKGYRTYMAAIGILLHQALSQFFGIDLPTETWSHVTDGLLGLAAIYFRWKANK